MISLTRCASRQSGFAAAIWLLVMGVFGKLSGFFATIPNCVLGGVTVRTRKYLNCTPGQLLYSRQQPRLRERVHWTAIHLATPMQTLQAVKMGS